MQQITVCAVDLDHIEANAYGSLRCLNKGGNDTAQLVFIERMGHVPVFAKRDCACGHGWPCVFFRLQGSAAHPRNVRRRFPACVPDLNAEACWSA
jgi:hypothetical protein